MSEVIAAAIDHMINKVDELIVQAQTPTPAAPSYDFATPEFTVAFPVIWPNKEGRITVTHKLRRPTYGELITWKQKTVIEREYDKRGAEKRETTDTATADAWLWDQLALAVGGYPDLDDGMKAVTEADKKEMRSTHKEQAIGRLFKADADILLEESVVTYGGGEWVVALNIGHNSDAEARTVKFRFREWTQKERSDFTKLASISSNNSEGKATVKRLGIHLPAFAELFDELLIDVAGGVADGKTMAEMGRVNFMREICAEFKAVIIAELAIYWRKQLSD